KLVWTAYYWSCDCSKVRSGCSCVPVHLCHQRIDVGEFLLIAQFFQKAYGQTTPIQTSVEVEQMGLQRQPAVLLNCRPDSEARNAGPGCFRHALYFNNENSRKRSLGPFQLHVGGW